MSVISEAHANTFEWFWSSPDISFSSWLSQPRGLYWIQGSPGSGKSTLMKYIAQHGRLSTGLRTNSSSHHFAIAAYSFFVGVGGLARTTEGMLRSILWQLMQAGSLGHGSKSTDTVVKRYLNMRSSRTQVSWSSADLLDALLSFFEESPMAAFCLLVDGLDEYQGENRLVAEYINNMNLRMPANVRLVVASRPYPDFAFEFQNAKTITIQTHTANDIATYINAQFEDLMFKDLSLNDPSYQKLAKAVIKRARGSFMWVSIVCRKLRQEWRSFQSFERLEACLQALPAELKNLYLQILDQLQPSEKDDLSRMLTILVDCEGPLDIPEFCHAFDLTKTETCPSSLKLLASPLEPALRSLSREGKIPAHCHCRILWQGCRPHEDDEGADELPHPDDKSGSDAEFHSDVEPFKEDHEDTEHNRNNEAHRPNAANSHSTQTNTTILKYELQFICKSGIMGRGKVPELLASVADCPHTWAYTCSSFQISTKEWLKSKVVQINLIGRGLLRADPIGVTLAHKIVASFWKSEKMQRWQHSLQEGGSDIMLQACVVYLQVLAETPIILKSHVNQGLRERLWTHYSFSIML